VLPGEMPNDRPTNEAASAGYNNPHPISFPKPEGEVANRLALEFAFLVGKLSPEVVEQLGRWEVGRTEAGTSRAAPAGGEEATGAPDTAPAADPAADSSGTENT